MVLPPWAPVASHPFPTYKGLQSTDDSIAYTMDTSAQHRKPTLQSLAQIINPKNCELSKQLWFHVTEFRVHLWYRKGF